MAADLVFVSRDLLRAHACSGQSFVQRLTRARAALPVDDSDVRAGQLCQLADLVRTTLGRDEANLPTRKGKEDHPLFACGEANRLEVIVAAFSVTQTNARRMYCAGGQCCQRFSA